jgi:DNA-binding HxlR family transcriptional regulator
MMMWTYGQYCPLAHSLEILGDRWTLLIIRDLMKGIGHFNDLERGLPGISRGLLSKRLQQLVRAGVVEKRFHSGRTSTEYHLTQAGHDLEQTIHSLWLWGMQWAFSEPTPEELNSPLLMWRMHKEVNTAYLPEERIVVRFVFYGVERSSYWLILNRDDVSLCLTDPGFDINVMVSADLTAFFQIWAQRISYYEALTQGLISIEGAPSLVRDFSKWFEWYPTGAKDEDSTNDDGSAA